MSASSRPSYGAIVIALLGVAAGLMVTLWAGRTFLGDGVLVAFPGVLAFWLVLLVWFGGMPSPSCSWCSRCNAAVAW